MIRRILKLTLTLTLIAALSMSVMALSFAADPIKVTVGGEGVPISPVLIQEGRTYAPYDVLFTALGAQASYNKAEGTITAAAGNTEITIPINSSIMTINVDGDDYYMRSYALPIENTSTGDIYVPVRYVSQALGYCVSWDGPRRTVVLKQLDALIAESGATYDVMDKLLDYYEDFVQKCHAVDGSFELTLGLDTILYGMEESGAEMSMPDSLTVSGTATGLFDQGGEEMSISLKTNFSDLSARLTEDMMLTEEDQALLELMDDMAFDVIVNTGSGTTYMKSPLFTVLGDVPEDAWVYYESGGTALDLLGIIDTTGYSENAALSLLQLAQNGSSFEEYVRDVLRGRLLDGYDDIGETLDSINELFSDQAMDREGETYSVTLAATTEIYSGYSSTDTVDLVITFEGGAFSGISFVQTSVTELTYYDDYSSIETVVLSTGYTADGHGSLELGLTMDGETQISILIDFTYTETDGTPAREPEAGSTLISMDDMYIY